MGGYAGAEIPIIVRGDGCYLEDAHGKRYLDALAGLFAVQIGYSYGEEIGEAAAAQMRELPFYTNWSYAHPRAIELAAEVASLADAWLAERFGRPLDYVRVDLLLHDDEWVVSELELIEPGLYLDVLPANATPFADLVAARLG